jgi:hypothetical protein
MSQKPFEHIENKIIEAAAMREPSFNEYAWQQMELLLDKEDRKKRRFFIWWRIGLPLLLFALVAGGTLFLYQSNSKNKKSFSSLQKSNNSNHINTVIEKPSINKTTAINPQNTTVQSKLIVQSQLKTPNRISPIKPSLTSKNLLVNNGNSAKTKALKKLPLHKKGNASINISDISIDENNQLPIKETAATLPSQESTKKLEINKDISALVTANVIDSSNSQVKVLNETSIHPENKTNNSHKSILTNKVPSSRFYILASAGADIAGVKFLSFANSTLKSRVGVAFGYQLNNKLSVQAGIYVGRKIYEGGPDDYHAKQGSYWSMVKINKVEASCLVYDIPVSIRYDILQKRRINFYAVAGLSSFIMKKEDYYYYYTAYNMDREKDYSYTGNEHLFSNLILSAGMERILTANLSIQAEPYLSIPLKGVGDGQVKLFSAGLLIGLKYKPGFKLFKKKL